MLLTNCKQDIDTGKTAKLFIIPDLPSTLRFTVRIKLIEGGYAWQHVIHNQVIFETLTSSSVVTQTTVFPTWEQLLEGIEGMQTETHGWLITDEPLQDYLPERKMVKEDTKERP